MRLNACEGYSDAGLCPASATVVNYYRIRPETPARTMLYCEHCANRERQRTARVLDGTVLYDYYLPLIRPDITTEVTTGIEAFCHALARWESP